MTEDVAPYMARPRERATVEELRELIEKMGVSQRRAAEALDLDERTFRYYASGQKPIPIAVIYALRYLASEELERANLLVDVQTTGGCSTARRSRRL